MCNEATIVNDTALGGNATDRAILQFVENTSTEILKAKWMKKLDIPFNSKDKYMISLVEPVKTTATSSWNEIGFEDNENFLC